MKQSAQPQAYLYLRIGAVSLFIICITHLHRIEVDQGVISGASLLFIFGILFIPKNKPRYQWLIESYLNDKGMSAHYEFIITHIQRDESFRFMGDDSIRQRIDKALGDIAAQTDSMKPMSYRVES